MQNKSIRGDETVTERPVSDLLDMLLKLIPELYVLPSKSTELRPATIGLNRLFAPSRIAALFFVAAMTLPLINVVTVGGARTVSSHARGTPPSCMQRFG